MSTPIKLPNFLIIGVQKAGTTSVYNYLKQHPQVYMSKIKEPNFLARDPQRTVPPRPTRSAHQTRIDTFEKYCDLFQEVTDQIAIGEASANYLVNYRIVTEQIKRYIPHAKLIAILRDPAERAYSDYLMKIRDAIGKSRPLSWQIVHKGKKSDNLRKGFYYEHLSYFYEHFDRQQIQVLWYEDLKKNPLEFMQKIYEFIGVEVTFQPDTSRQAQVAQLPKNHTLNQILKTPNPLRQTTAKILNTLLPTGWVRNLRHTLVNWNQSQEKVPPLPSHERQALIAFYRDDILKLQELTNRDLSHWLQ